MTQQSGQGAASSDPQQPAARPAHEGVVLPADGGAPLLPGTAGRHSAPTGGSPWGEPWGPESAGPPPGGHTYGQGQAWDTPQQPAAQPLPPEGTPQQGYGAQGYDSQGYGAQGHAPQGYAPQPQASHGAHAAPQSRGAHAAPAPQQGHGAPSYGGQPVQGAHGAHQGHGAHAAPQAQPLPPVAQHQQLPAGPPPAVQVPQSMPLPSVAAPGAPSDGDATQYIPPVPAGADEGATQYIPPVPAAGGADEGATQYIPPVGPGALPPETPAADATQFLGRPNAPVTGAAPGALPAAAAPGAMPPGASPDSEATQYIAPVPGAPAGQGVPPEPAAAPYGIRPGAPGDRQPPAEFDSLFRTEPEGPASTQQMPRVEVPGPAPAPGQGGGGRGHGSRGRAGGGGGSKKVPLLAVVGVGIAALGIGAGALLSSGGGEDDEKKDDGKPVSASAEPDERPSPTADPAKDQAVALDKLLADSNNSRDSVIAAVRNVGSCKNLGQSAKDLRAAAKQRNGLVTRLAGLKVDKLPANDQLTASLTKAWKASAAADNHYAAWADQVARAGKKGCKKGHARTTSQTAAGNRQSGAATTAKEQAANHWNAIARKYGLTQRNKTQL
ncbi:hypothetical protein [Streptomyces luteocolor]|uniref:hypothetical protein n=2 Tax=Streptomyces TaxID=1883 RepID=UPI000853AB1C|nr:hypothetical protein [Streptomyces luteocolor]